MALRAGYAAERAGITKAQAKMAVGAMAIGSHVLLSHLEDDLLDRLTWPPDWVVWPQRSLAGVVCPQRFRAEVARLPWSWAEVA